MKIDEAIKQLRESSKKREFPQTFDLVVSLKNFDLKKPENKFTKDVILPSGTGRTVEIGIISDRIPDSITKAQLEQIANSKQEAKKLAKKYDFFICEAPLMVLVGKILGRYLGPKGKMPKLLAPNQNPSALTEDLKKSVRIKAGDSAAIQTYVGRENMSDEDVKKNIERVVDEIKKSLPKGENQIKNVMLKMTMSKPVKIE